DVLSLRVVFLLPLVPSSTLFPYTTLFRSIRDDVLPIQSRSPAPQIYQKQQIHSHSSKHILHPPDKVHLLFHRQSDIDQKRNVQRSEEHTSELQSRENVVCRLLLEKKTVTD